MFSTVFVQSSPSVQSSPTLRYVINPWSPMDSCKSVFRCRCWKWLTYWYCYCSLVCLSCSCIVLKWQKILTRCILYTTAPCLSQIMLNLAYMSQPFLLQILPHSDHPCWFEHLRHSMWPNGYRQHIGHNGEPTRNDHHSFEWYHRWPPFPQNGVPNASPRTNSAMRASTWRIW